MTGDNQARLWARIQTACGEHADFLERAASDLKAAWPVAPASAAEFLQNTIEEMVRSMRETANSAGQHSATLVTFNESLSAARGVVDQLRLQYREASHANKAIIDATVRGVMAKIDADASVARGVANSADLETYAGLVRSDLDPVPPKGSGGGSPQNGGSPWSGGAPHIPMAAGPMGRTPDESPVLAGGVTGVNLPGSTGWGPETLPATGGQPTMASPEADVAQAGPFGRVIGGTPTGPSTGSPQAGVVRPGMASGSAGGSSAPGHGPGVGGLIGSAPMMAGGQPTTTRDGTRVGRPGGVIGGGGKRRRRPYDPDDPWTVEHEVVAPVIGGSPPTVESGHDDLPPGVVSIEGWPR